MNKFRILPELRESDSDVFQRSAGRLIRAIFTKTMNERCGKYSSVNIAETLRKVRP